MHAFLQYFSCLEFVSVLHNRKLITVFLPLKSPCIIHVYTFTVVLTKHCFNCAFSPVRRTPRRRVQGCLLPFPLGQVELCGIRAHGRGQVVRVWGEHAAVLIYIIFTHGSL